MEFKGISWAGNIYEKFEAMCLEVEEVMYEDTVKYVESQVQKVGESVKNFYADVVEDLLPPSRDIDEKLKRIASDIHRDVNKREGGDEGICDEHLSPMYEECSRKSIGIKRSSLSPDRSSSLVEHDSLVASDGSNGTTSSQNKPISDQIPSSESIKQEKEDDDTEETISSHEDNFDVELIETFERVEKSMLEESCILVEGDEDELDFVSQGRKKHKSYKKKICDALSLKLRPTRKQNGPAKVKSVAVHNSCDFGWELV